MSTKNDDDDDDDDHDDDDDDDDDDDYCDTGGTKNFNYLYRPFTKRFVHARYDFD